MHSYKNVIYLYILIISLNYYIYIYIFFRHFLNKMFIIAQDYHLITWGNQHICEYCGSILWYEEGQKQLKGHNDQNFHCVV